MKCYPQPLSEEFIYASPEGQWPAFCRWMVLDQQQPISQETRFEWEESDEPHDCK